MTRMLPRTKPDQWHDLPAVNTIRWVASQKEPLVKAVLDKNKPGITAEAVCLRYGLSPEEFAEWTSRFQEHGTIGLKVTKQLRT